MKSSPGLFVDRPVVNNAIRNGREIKAGYSAGFTLDTYTHATSDMQKAAANKVGLFIAQAV